MIRADLLQNIANVAKSALSAGLIKTDARGMADLWGQVAQVEDVVAELRRAEATPAAPTSDTPV